MKFCKKCGLFQRQDVLKKNHFKFCQPDKLKEESGFLLDGQIPEENVTEFRATLKILGGCEKVLKKRKSHKEEPAIEDTLSDYMEEICELLSKKSANADDIYSQESFGQTS